MWVCTQWLPTATASGNNARCSQTTPQMRTRKKAKANTGTQTFHGSRKKRGARAMVVVVSVRAMQAAIDTPPTPPGDEHAAGDGAEVQHVDGRGERECIGSEQLVERIEQVRHARPRGRAVVLHPGGNTDEGRMAGYRPHQELGMGEVAGEVPGGPGNRRQGDDDDDRRRDDQHDRVPPADVDESGHTGRFTRARRR